MAHINQEILENYITRQELIRLTDDENINDVNHVKLEEAIEASCYEFDSYLRDRFEINSFPNPLPEMFNQIICDITIYNLYKRRFALDMPESIINLYKAAIDKLKKIATGEIQTTLPKKIDAVFIKINKTETDRIFNKDNLNRL